MKIKIKEKYRMVTATMQEYQVCICLVNWKEKGEILKNRIGYNFNLAWVHVNKLPCLWIASLWQYENPEYPLRRRLRHCRRCLKRRCQLLLLTARRRHPWLFQLRSAWDATDCHYLLTRTALAAAAAAPAAQTLLPPTQNEITSSALL